MVLQKSSISQWKAFCHPIHSAARSGAPNPLNREACTRRFRCFLSCSSSFIVYSLFRGSRFITFFVDLTIDAPHLQHIFQSEQVRDFIDGHPFLCREADISFLSLYLHFFGSHVQDFTDFLQGQGKAYFLNCVDVSQVRMFSIWRHLRCDLTSAANLFRSMTITLL